MLILGLLRLLVVMLKMQSRSPAFKFKYNIKPAIIFTKKLELLLLYNYKSELLFFGTII